MRSACPTEGSGDENADVGKGEYEDDDDTNGHIDGHHEGSGCCRTIQRRHQVQVAFFDVGKACDQPLTEEYVPLTPELRNAVRNFASYRSYGREDRPRRRSERLRDEWRAEQRSRRRLWDGSEAHEFKNLVVERLADPGTDFLEGRDRVANLKQAGAAFRGIGHHEIPLLASADADS